MCQPFSADNPANRTDAGVTLWRFKGVGTPITFTYGPAL
jgi:hypothetical protein